MYINNPPKVFIFLKYFLITKLQKYLYTMGGQNKALYSHQQQVPWRR